MAYKKSNVTSMTAATDTRIVALYVRVSTGYQVDKDSLPFQKKELQNYCEHILHIDESRIEIFEDAGKSGKNTKRPAFERLIKKVRAGLVSHVLVYKIDRITRNLVDFSLMYDDFKYNRVTFISLNEQFDTSSAIGEAILKIILVFAELERKLTSERVTDIMLERANAGQWNGARVPYGWCWNEETQMPEHDPVESIYAKQMYEMYKEVKSSCKIRDYNNAHGIPTKRGGKWTSKTVADFIRNPMNKGDYRYNFRESARGRKKPDDEVIYVKDVFNPLVDKELWDYCNKIMDSNAAMKRKNGVIHLQKHIHIFSGMLICGDCGSTYNVSRLDTRRKNGFAPTLYVCSNKRTHGSCTSDNCSDVTLGPFIINYIRSMVMVMDNKKNIHNIYDLEHFLLADQVFKNVAGIVTEDLENTYNYLFKKQKTVSYTPTLAPAHVSDTNKTEELKQIISKSERALERLKKVFLFSDDGINEKEYLEMKLQIESEKIAAENELKTITESMFEETINDVSFIRSASAFLIANELKTKEHIKYRDFAATIEDRVLKKFIETIIDKIVIVKRRPVEIIFKNGLSHRFLYHED